MLFNVAFPKDRNHFNACIENIKESYWPQQMYERLFNDSPPPLTIGNIKENRTAIDSKLIACVQSISTQQLYSINHSTDTSERKVFPFISLFHHLFMKRRWDYETSEILHSRPVDMPLFRLKDSKNYANFNHFINVVAAVARLINYFSDEQTNASQKIAGILATESSNATKLNLYEQLSYNNRQTHRVFNLMLSAFYHDIGKTVVDHRHGMEGAIIFFNHPSRSAYQLREIYKVYKERYGNRSGRDFNKDDIYFIAHMIEFHDFFGTLSTGETGYAKLVGIVDIVKRYSLLHDQELSLLSHQHLFDLWLLNLADILVSREEEYPGLYAEQKSEEQKWWREEASSWQKIDCFFSSEKASLLIHDLNASFKVLASHLKDKHTDDTTIMHSTCIKITKRHVIERLRRLISETLYQSAHIVKKNIGSLDSQNSDQLKLMQSIEDMLNNDHSLSFAIVKSVQDTMVYDTFCDRFSIIGQMDYSLGFFNKIAIATLGAILNEMNDGEITNYVRKCNEDARSKDVGDFGDYLWEIQARFFLDNYISTLIHVISYIITKNDQINEIVNLEFIDATARLNDEKIKSLSSLAGPARNKRATKLILQSIMYWS